MDKIKIAVLGIDNDVYYAKEYDVYNNQVQKLEQLAAQLNFEVLKSEPVKTEMQAKKTLESFKAQNADYLLVQHSGFSVGEISKALENYPCPIGVWAVAEPTQNGDIKLHSFVSMNLYASVSKRCYNNVKCKWFYGEANSEIFKKRFEATLGALRAIKALKNAKIGFIGDAAPGFYNLETNGKHYSDKFGIKFVKGTVKELASYAKSLEQKEIDEACDLILSTASECCVDRESLINGAKAYLSLKHFCEINEVSSLAAACWPDFQDEFNIVPCVPFTMLGTFDKIPVACEGDVGAAVSLLLATAASNNIATVMDVAAVDEEENAILLWHCGIGSCDLAPKKEDVKIIYHPMMNRKNENAPKFGLSYDYNFKPQDVVVSRLTDDGKLVFSFSGEFIKAKDAYDGTRGWVGNLKKDAEDAKLLDVVNTMMREGVEHHLVVSAGIGESAFLEFAELTNTPIVKIIPYKDHL